MISKLWGSSTGLLLALLGLDMAFIVVYAALSFTGGDEHNRFSLGKDGGYPEVFQYVKLLLIATGLAVLARFAREWGFLLWSLLFLYLFLDDALQIHERTGEYAHARWGAAGDERRDVQQAMEIGFSLLVGFGLFALMIPTYLRGSAFLRKASRGLAALLAGLAAFGLGMDTVHTLSEGGWLWKGVLGAFEEGGEMMCLSLCLAYVAHLLLVRNGASAELMIQ